MTKPALVYLVEAAEGSHPGDLHHHHRDDLSVVYVHASVAAKTLAQAAMTILSALGKREDVTGLHDHASDNVYLTPIWLIAHRTEVIIIGSAQVWPSRLTTDLLRLLSAGPSTVVLAVDHGRAPEVRNTASGFTPAHVEWDDLNNLLPAQSPKTSAVATTSALAGTAVPESNWTTFRADARAMLTPAAFAELDKRYLAALDTTREALVAGAVHDNDTTRAHLIELIRSSANSQEVTAALRAAQAAHFEHGVNLRISVRRALVELAHSRQAAYSPSDWRIIRAYREPHRTAICALYGHGLPVNAIERFTMLDAAKSLRDRAVEGDPLTPDGSAYLRAQYLNRTLEGASPQDPFIISRAIGGALAAACNDLGLLVANQPKQRSQHTMNLWKFRLGFLRQVIS